MTLSQWRKKYGAVADSQGWNLFESGLRGLEIQRVDEVSVGIDGEVIFPFPADEDAVDFVGAAMLRGEPAAGEALILVNAQHSEPEGV